MNRTWTVCRQFSPSRDAERRWDQAYQLLVRWAGEGSLPRPAPQSISWLPGIAPAVFISCHPRSVSLVVDAATGIRVRNLGGHLRQPGQQERRDVVCRRQI